MGDVLARRRLLTAARAELLERPDVDLSGIPPHVAASWRRSVARGVDPGVVVNRFHPELDLESRLVRCARPIVAQLAEQVAGIPVCVVLTDERARLLIRLDTTAEVGRLADGTNFAEGFGYDEGAVGTNGVGTVLESGGPTFVVGAEHFVEQLHPYACAGAPVRDPSTGRIEGVLDVSCRAEHSSPLLLSLVSASAGRIQDALLHDRDAEQQALFDLYTRVEARTRRAVLAVGRRTVLTNTAMQTLVDAGDLAALQDHARFLMQRGPGVDDRLDLPSGVRVRMRGTTLALGGSATGLVAVVTLLREADGVAVCHDRPPPEPPPGRPWGRTAWADAVSALRAGTPLVVVGEPGSGRRRLVVDAHAAVHGAGRVTEIGPADVETGDDRAPAGASGALVLLRDVDRWTRSRAATVAAAVGARGLRVAVTATRPERCPGAVAALLTPGRRSITVPPLRTRSRELPTLVADLLAELAPDRDTGLSAEALRTLARHTWPGNVVELRGVLEEALRMRPVGVIEAQDLPVSVQSVPHVRLRPVDQAERDTIVAALRESGGKRVAAAAALGLARSTLYRKIAQYGITG